MAAVHIKHGDFSAEVWPEVGVVAALSVRRNERNVALLYTEPQAKLQPGAIHRFGLWPLVPFANRAFGAKLDTGIEVIGLPANDPSGGDSTLHGFSWQNPWSLASHDEARVVMEQEVRRNSGPYHYAARFSVLLDDAGATFDLAVRNMASRALPFGLGFHPWFPRGVVTLKAEAELVLGHGFKPVHAMPVSNPCYFPDQAKLHSNNERAANYLRWNGIAHVALAEEHAKMIVTASPNLRHPVLWQPVGAPFMCLEPQTHAIGAPSEAVVRVLTPLHSLIQGETLSGTMRIELA